MTHSPDMSRVRGGMIVETKVSRRGEKQVGDCRGRHRMGYDLNQISIVLCQLGACFTLDGIGSFDEMPADQFYGWGIEKAH